MVRGSFGNVMLRSFYETYFEEIVKLLRVRNPRLVLEDYNYLEPSLRSLFSEHHLFVYQVNLAIRDGALRKDMF